MAIIVDYDSWYKNFNILMQTSDLELKTIELTSTVTGYKYNYGWLIIT